MSRQFAVPRVCLLVARRLRWRWRSRGWGLRVPSPRHRFLGGSGLLAFGRLSPDLEVTTIAVVDPRSGRTRAVTHVPRRCAGSWTWGDS